MMHKENVRFVSELNFKSFISKYEPIKDLDQITEDWPKGKPVADYLVENLLVIELKTLRSDPEQKIVDHTKKVMDSIEGNLPVFYGKINFRKAARMLPNSEEAINKLDSLYFRQIEKIISKADKQIRSTVEVLEMDVRTHGVLIIINEDADYFQPETLVGYICRMLGKKDVNGQPRISNIHTVILMQDTYMVDSNSDYRVLPQHQINNSYLERTEISLKAEAALEDMNKNFAFFNGVSRVVENDPKELPKTRLIIKKQD